MKWYFIRHGQIASNLKKIYSGRSAEALTDIGQQQVRFAAHGLVGTPIDELFSSPLKRTRQSAEIIIDELNLDLTVQIDERFNELQMGPWEGMSEIDVEQEYPDEWALWNKRPAELMLEGRETLAELQARVLEGLRAIRHADENKSVLVVTHVAIIRVISLYANGLDLNGYKQVPVDNASVLEIENLEL